MNIEHQGFRLFDYVEIVLRWKRFIIFNVLFVTITAIIISLLLPKWYKATTTILPPKEPVINGLSMSSTVKSVSGMAGLAGLSKNTIMANYMAILKSRIAMETVVNKFDLIRFYDIPNNSLERAIEELRDNVSFEMQEDDYLAIVVYDKVPQRSADIANYFVDVLNTLSIQLNIQEAKNNREFIEKRVEENKISLQTAEELLQRYQERTGNMFVPGQNSSSISAIAELYGLKAKREIELAILEQRLAGDNELIRRLKIELSELGKKLISVPQTGIESFRLYRDIAIHQKIVEYLIPLFEQAKIEEQKNIPVLLVLDKAIPPERKARPQRAVIVVAAFILSLVLGIIVAFSSTAISRYLQENREQAQQLKSTMKRNNNEK